MVSPETTVAAVFRPDGFGADVSGKRDPHPGDSSGREGLPPPARLQQRTGRVAPPHRAARRSRDRVPHGPRSFPSSATRAAWASRRSRSTRPAAWRCVIRDRVLLVDASLQMGVCASLLDLTPATSLMDVVREADRLDETLHPAIGHAALQRLAPSGRAGRCRGGRRDRRRGDLPHSHARPADL